MRGAGLRFGALYDPWVEKVSDRMRSGSLRGANTGCRLDRVRRGVYLVGRPGEAATHHNIPVTAPTCTLIDLATVLPRRELEAAINQADKLDGSTSTGPTSP